MIPRIIRILLIIISVFVMGFYLPALYKKCFEKRPDKTMLYYSEVSKDFIIAQETGDSLSEKRTMQYYDKDNNELSEQEAMQLLPFNNIKRLRLLGLMPDSIDGVELSEDILKTTWRSVLIPEQGFSYQINPLFESKPKNVYLSLPDDLFRINNHGIEFLQADNKHINKEKSELFNATLSSLGFASPAKAIYGIPSTLKRKDDGYFIVDKKNDLFHLKMEEGKPYCHKIETSFDLDIKLIKCHSSGDGLYAHLFDKENNIYVLTHNYEIKQLPIKTHNARVYMVVTNYFYRTYKVTTQDSVSLYVLTPEYDFVDKHSIAVNNYSHSDEAMAEKYIFPFKMMQTPGMVYFIPIPNPISKFICISLILVLSYLCFKLITKQKIFTTFNIIDLILIGIFGIYGFIGVLIFPNKEKNLKA